MSEFVFTYGGKWTLFIHSGLAKGATERKSERERKRERDIKRGS